MNLVLLDSVGPSVFPQGSDPNSGGGPIRVSGEQARHLLSVLNVVPGQQVRVGVVDGPCGTGTVTAVHADAVDLACAFEKEIPPRPPVDLLLALPRPKVMRRLWAQLAALGVGQIVLTNAARVERHYFDTHVLTPECYRPLLVEGLQQARDTRLPRVSIHKQFKVLVEDDLDAMTGDAHRLVAHPGAEPSIAAAASGRTVERMLLAIGPEGGWNAFELDLLKAHGFQPVGMGPRTLRTDTACIALLALAHGAFRLKPEATQNAGS